MDRRIVALAILDAICNLAEQASPAERAAIMRDMKEMGERLRAEADEPKPH